MPIRLFEDGEILNADSVNQYFMDQALVVFDSATERNDAFNETPGLDPEKPDLQEGRICYLKSDDKIYIYTGSAWTPQLAIIEAGVVTTEKLDGTSGSEAVTEAKIRNGAVTVNKIGTGAVTSDKIENLTIVNGDIATNAAIALSKLASGTSGQIIVADASGVPTWVSETGDVTIDSSGVTAIATGAVTSGKLGSDLSLTGTTKIEEIFEKASIVDAQPVAANGGTLTLTITDGAVYYYTTSTTRNVVLDIVTTGMLTLQAVTVMVAITSGSTAGKISEIKVNGVTNTAKWFGGNPLPNGSGGGAVDAYTITVFRKDSTYTVFASQSKFA
jgi:hypothetical protein